MKEKDKNYFDSLPDSRFHNNTVCCPTHLYTYVTPMAGSQNSKTFLNIGWIYFCMYVYYRLSKRYTSWWNSLKEKTTNN